MGQRYIDNCHARKLIDHCEKALRDMCNSGVLLGGRLVWGCRYIPIIESYLGDLGQEIARPSILRKYEIEPRLMVKQHPLGDEQWKVQQLHWRLKRALADELVDWFLDVGTVAREVQRPEDGRRSA